MTNQAARVDARRKYFNKHWNPGAENIAILTGKTGSGKTYLMMRYANEALSRGIPITVIAYGPIEFDKALKTELCTTFDLDFNLPESEVACRSASGGVLFLDEFWIIERYGREYGELLELALKYDVYVVLVTQCIQDVPPSIRNAAGELGHQHVKLSRTITRQTA